MSFVFADTHVHLYPVFPKETLPGLIHSRIQCHTPEAEGYVIMLAERSSDHAFEDLCKTGIPGAEQRISEDNRVLALNIEDMPAIHIISGKQMATAEKMEVLALGTTCALPDGLSLMDSIAAAREAGGFPVIPWAPGKWMFKRKKVLLKALEKNTGPVALSDSAMRFTGCPAPSVFRQSKRDIIPILAGSDPLPHRGEEKVIGRYGITLDLDLSQPLIPQITESIMKKSYRIAGTRRTVIEAATAQYRHMKG